VRMITVKNTLADRLLGATQTVTARQEKRNYLITWILRENVELQSRVNTNGIHL
jgi:hypothetical protein